MTARGRETDDTEREVKLGVWPGFRMPDLDGVGEGTTATEVRTRRLEATYHDTPDLRLARAGVSLRFRGGDGTGWTLKLPDRSDGPRAPGGPLVRRELTFPGSSKAVPARASSLLTAWVRSATLEPAIRLHTLRRSLDVVDAGGKALAEVVDDEVSVLDGRRVAMRFREVEVEMRDGATPEVMDALVGRLRAAGAGPPDPTPKVARALGPLAAGSPDLAPVVVGAEATAVDVLRAALTSSVLRLLDHDAGVRLGDDAEEVHQARVATRRLRSDLRTYRSLLDPDWSDGLREELRGVAAALGAVRDADVLLERLGAAVGDLRPEDARQGRHLLDRLSSERDTGRAGLLTLMDDPAYAALLERLVAAAREPVVLQEASAPAEAVLPGLVVGPWKHLDKAAAGVGPDSPDDALHEIRIRAKRCRYAAEVAAFAVGRPATRFAKAVAEVQEVLGSFQDAVVTEDWLRQASSRAPAARALVAGQLIGASRAEAAAARRNWLAAWKALDRPKLRSWMRP